MGDEKPSAPLSAEEGVDAEDATFINDPDSLNADAQDVELCDDAMEEADHLDASNGAGETEMVDMVALMDALQCVGVGPVEANRCVASLVRKGPSVMGVHGRGKIVESANTTHRDLNILSDLALHLRSKKPTGEPWDFTKKHDRLEAIRLVKERKPIWVIGSPPCTAFSQLQSLSPASERKEKTLQEGIEHMKCGDAK